MKTQQQSIQKAQNIANAINANAYQHVFNDPDFQCWIEFQQEEIHELNDSKLSFNDDDCCY